MSVQIVQELINGIREGAQNVSLVMVRRIHNNAHKHVRS